jgi:hypothetical protein
MLVNPFSKHVPRVSYEICTIDPCFILGLCFLRCQHISNQHKWKTNYNVFNEMHSRYTKIETLFHKIIQNIICFKHKHLIWVYGFVSYTHTFCNKIFKSLQTVGYDCPPSSHLLTSILGRAIAQAVSCRLPTTAARVQTRVWSCGILWWTKVALGQVFSENFGFPCQSTFHLLLHNHLHYHPRLAQ